MTADFVKLAEKPSFCLKKSSFMQFLQKNFQKSVDKT
jgi:hypothetical protein